MENNGKKWDDLAEFAKLDLGGAESVHDGETVEAVQDGCTHAAVDENITSGLRAAIGLPRVDVAASLNFGPQPKLVIQPGPPPMRLPKSANAVPALPTLVPTTIVLEQTEGLEATELVDGAGEIDPDAETAPLDAPLNGLLEEQSVEALLPHAVKSPEPPQSKMRLGGWVFPAGFATAVAAMVALHLTPASKDNIAFTTTVDDFVTNTGSVSGDLNSSAAQVQAEPVETASQPVLKVTEAKRQAVAEEASEPEQMADPAAWSEGNVDHPDSASNDRAQELEAETKPERKRFSERKKKVGDRFVEIRLQRGNSDFRLGRTSEEESTETP